MQSPPGELIHKVMSPLPALSSSANALGVTSSSNQDSSAIGPHIDNVRPSLESAKFQNLLFIPTSFLVRSTSIFKRCHCSVYHVFVSALFIRYRIHIFKCARIVRRHDAVLDSDCVALHSACIIATQQAIYIELDSIFSLFVIFK